MATPALPSPDDLRNLLRGVIDPELGSDIVELGMVRDATIDDAGQVVVTIALTTSGCPLRAQIQRDIRTRIGSVPGVAHVQLEWTEMTQAEKSRAMEKARFNVSQRPEDTSVGPRTRVVLVASGKGGVGKSSVTANLAAALASRGLTGRPGPNRPASASTCPHCAAITSGSSLPPIVSELLAVRTNKQEGVVAILSFSKADNFTA